MAVLWKFRIAIAALLPLPVHFVWELVKDRVISGTNRYLDENFEGHMRALLASILSSPWVLPVTIAVLVIAGIGIHAYWDSRRSRRHEPRSALDQAAVTHSQEPKASAASPALAARAEDKTRQIFVLVASLSDPNMRSLSNNELRRLAEQYVEVIRLYVLNHKAEKPEKTDKKYRNRFFSHSCTLDEALRRRLAISARKNALHGTLIDLKEMTAIADYLEDLARQL